MSDCLVGHSGWLAALRRLKNLLQGGSCCQSALDTQAQRANELYTLSAGIADEVPTFNRLPSHEAEALLLQAWQQLDQHHRFGIIPRVCRTWYHLSLPSFTTLELIVHHHESVQELALWLRHHGSTLRHFSLDLSSICHQHLPWGELAGAIRSCTFLAGLQLIHWDAATLPDLQQFTQLSSLEFSASASSPSTQRFLKHLPSQLLSLNLYQTWLGSSVIWYSCTEPDIHEILRRLPGLTRLDARRTSLPFRYLASCPNLPPLQELKLDLKWRYTSDSELAALAKLPCSFLAVDVCSEYLEKSLTWCRRQEGMACLSKLTSMSWHFEGSGYRPWSNAVLSCLATAATSLKDLNLSGGGFMDVGLLNITPLSRLSQLTKLSFHYGGSPDADVVSAFAALPNLQELTVAGLSAVQGDAWRAAASVCGQLHSLRKLTLEK